MVSEDDLEWLAGLSDAEACFHLGMNGSRRGNVVALFQVGLVRHEAVEIARRLITEIVGEAVPEIHVRPATGTQREFYSLTVAAKHQALAIIGTICPQLQGKRAEALASADVLRRAIGGHYTAIDLDRQLCELSSQIKKGDVAKKQRVAALLGASLSAEAPTTAWLAGMLDGDGSISVIRDTRESAAYYYPIVSISSSDRPAIEDLRSVVSTVYRVTSLATKEAKGGARQNHSFNIVTDDIERFLGALRPHLRVKRAEADVMLDVCRGKTSREAAYDILRALKKDDDPDTLLKEISAGGAVPSEPKRVSRIDRYRRPTYDEMKRRGLWSSDESREHLGGIGHAAWMLVTNGLVPDATIGNKKYYSPENLRKHVTEHLGAIVRTDARERMRRAMESWQEAKA